MEIITVTDAQGAAIEKKEISSISVDVNTGLVNIGNQNAILRSDGQWIKTPNYGGPLSLIASDFTEDDLTDFNTALTGFKDAIVALAAKKLGV